METQQLLQQLAASLGGQLPKMADKAGSELRPLILITSVEMFAGQRDTLEVRDGDEPVEVAKAFCRKHGLPDTVVGPLTQHVVDKLREAIARTPISSESPLNITSNSAAAPAVAASGKGKGSQLDCGDADNKMREQLSSKLMAPNEARHDARNLMTANDFNSHAQKSVSCKTGGGPQSRKHGSVSSSPRGSRSSGSHAVHNRLYSYAQDKAERLEHRRKLAEVEETAELLQKRASMSWISSEMMKGRGSGLYENYGEMLYAEGVESWMIKEKKAEAGRLSRAEKELEGATFQPAITKKAYELKMREGSVPDSDANAKWDRMHQRGMTKQTLERLEDMRKAREVDEVKECTFKPRINASSAMHMKERSDMLKVLQLSHHEQLYADAQRRQDKMAELANWYPDGVTFKPSINQDAKAQEYLRRSWEKAVQGSSHASADIVPRPPVVDRLYASKERRDRKLAEQRAQLNGSTDPTTGKQLYKPETGRAPRNAERNREGKPIGEYLYQAAQDLAAKKEHSMGEERRLAEEAASRAATNGTSREIFHRLKLKRFVQIFEYLDEGRCGSVDLVGLVRAYGSRMERLDAEVLGDVQAAAAVWARAQNMSMDALQHQEQKNALEDGEESPHAPAPPPVDQETFLVLMDEALNTRRAPRSYLVPSPSSKNVPVHTFRPAVLAKSKELAAKLRGAASELPVHEFLHATAAVQRERLDALRRMNEDAELQECTFAPKLNAASLRTVSEGRALRMSGLVPGGNGNFGGSTYGANDSTSGSVYGSNVFGGGSPTAGLRVMAPANHPSNGFAVAVSGDGAAFGGGGAGTLAEGAMRSLGRSFDVLDAGSMGMGLAGEATASVASNAGEHGAAAEAQERDLTALLNDTELLQAHLALMEAGNAIANGDRDDGYNCSVDHNADMGQRHMRMQASDLSPRALQAGMEDLLLDALKAEEEASHQGGYDVDACQREQLSVIQMRLVSMRAGNDGAGIAPQQQQGESVGGGLSNSRGAGSLAELARDMDGWGHDADAM